jgi:hypothetical protein
MIYCLLHVVSGHPGLSATLSQLDEPCGDRALLPHYSSLLSKAM